MSSDEQIQGLADWALSQVTYKSKAEESWAVYGNILLRKYYKFNTHEMLYEPMLFYLPGSRYKPDFLHLLDDGRHVFVEVKTGGRPLRSYRSARASWRAAAKVYPWYIWVWAVVDRQGNWELEVAGAKNTD